MSHGAVPGFVPARFAPMLRTAAQRWNVSAKLLAAQLYAESGFNPFAVSKAGAQGIAQFMPATARGMGLDDPFDAEQAIDAQAHLMRDLLRQFGSVPLALAAYNAGPGAGLGCGCVPHYAETRGYVARILGLMSGAGVPIPLGRQRQLALEVRLVRWSAPGAAACEITTRQPAAPPPRGRAPPRWVKERRISLCPSSAT